jgi:hypothetical protein
MFSGTLEDRGDTRQHRAPGLAMIRSSLDSPERVRDTDAIDNLAMAQVFGQYCLATGFPCAVDNEGIPIRNLVKAVQVNSRENVAQHRFDQVEPGEDLYFSTCDGRIQTQFPRGDPKVFLKDLERNDSAAIFPVRSD